MEEKIAKQLYWYYYGMMVLTLLVGAVAYLLFVHLRVFDPLATLSPLGQVVQYVVIADALFFIPMGLYGFKRRCDKIRRIEDETEKLRQYKKEAAIRIILVSNTMVLGLFAYYWLGCYQSMLWVAAISAIGFVGFTKPTPRRIQLELLPPDIENY